MLPDDYDLPEYVGPSVVFHIRYRPDDEDVALLLARRLFADLDLGIGAMTLVPGDDQRFEVDLDGESVFVADAGRSLPSAESLVRLARAKLEAEGRA